MECKVIGFSRMSGQAKATGKPYDMCRLLAIIPQQNAQSANMQKLSFGYEQVEIEVKPEAATSFYAAPYPCTLKLELEETMTPNMDGRAQFRKVAVGYTVLYSGLADPSLSRPTSATPAKALEPAKAAV